MIFEELKRLNKERTQGEWKYNYDGSSDWSIGPEDPQINPICTVTAYNFYWDEAANNAAFIAAAANNMDKLLAAVEAATSLAVVISDRKDPGSYPDANARHWHKRLTEALEALNDGN